ncbi:hypothetical protein E0E52_18090 [Azotobacter chroococcum]|uniref:hypothetical protein n=1 Tax=Azotobacter chroococcum TaxID=353 RepID=UPI00103CB56A|nr:hypothetical protein [Azotobacter chroococcum]TBW02150.1 hypothetical protein E0E52_18090 [Azotobacter chroococcum]
MANIAPLPNAAGLGTSNPQRLALDNLIRRELKVGDPNDPMQVAQALLDRYKGDPRAAAIAQEARGLPFLQTVASTPSVAVSPTATTAEWEQACNDIQGDLQHLTTDTILKDITPELQGWAQAIRTTLQEGHNAARFALDPRNRDKGFAMRRQLNDYARLARLVGSHTPAMTINYRKLAQSLDEAANLLLVIMGEALANVGFGGGRYLPQVAYSDLQTRRDAAIYALRNFVGSTQMAYGPDDWPRGLDAYRQLNELLERHGQGDLRSLLVETELARTMDELVQRSGDSTSGGMRAIGATAMLTLERFRRLVMIGGQRGVVSPESPALVAFLEALQLFASAFDSSGGFRLMKIARPPILFYGLYGNTRMDGADRRLVDMVTCRSQLADALDCMATSCCQDDKRVCIVLLDKVLYDVDRAIDLYSLGFQNFGRPEQRAAAYGFVIDAVKNIKKSSTSTPYCNELTLEAEDMAAMLDEIADNLRPKVTLASDGDFSEMVELLLSRAEKVNRLLQAIVFESDKSQEEKAKASTEFNNINTLMADIKNNKMSNENKLALTDIVPLYAKTEQTELHFDLDIDNEPGLDRYLEVLEEELCLQRDMERRWSNLVHSMVPNCSSLDQSLEVVVRMLDQAAKDVSGAACTDQVPINLPPALETLVDSYVSAVDRTGRGRPNWTQGR